jgi:hypothetical protein
MILTREAAGQRIHRRTVLEYALESQSASLTSTVSLLWFVQIFLKQTLIYHNLFLNFPITATDFNLFYNIQSF